ncbi:MAG: exonuclease SbcCD subunit D [Halobacteriovoraceae bacterium]|nr:exonuclease SbcCD subunit D [Halobacteriovoraceae bacterium]
MNERIKILHTSDWHLGKKLYSFSRNEEHKYFLNWLINCLEKEKIDLLFISGDVFDSPTPANSAIEDYFSFLHRISSIKDLKTFIISGNHDSQNFLQAPAELLKHFNIEVVTNINDKVDFEFKIRNTNIHIKCFPYFRTTDLIKYAHGLDHNTQNKFEDYDFQYLIEHFLNKSIDKNNLNLCLAHHLFANYHLSGSEIGLHLSGLDSIPKESFLNYNGVFLGHIHKKQDFSDKQKYMAYCGSPLAHRFSETNKKQIAIIEFDNDKYQTNWINVPTLKELLSLNITKYEIDNLPETFQDESKEILLELFITLDEPYPNLYEKIRTILPKHVKLLSLQISGQQYGQIKDYKKINGLNVTELFSDFYKDKYQKEIPLHIKKNFENIQQEILDSKIVQQQNDGVANEV